MQVATQHVINGVDIDELMKTIHTSQEQPGYAKSKFRVTNRWLKGGHNRTTIQGFYFGGKEDTSREKPYVLEADEPCALAGTDRGANPAEFTLTALAACLTTSMVYHAAANGIEIQEIESKLEGEMDLRGFMGVSNDVPKGFQNIRVTFRIKSDAPAEKLKELTKFSPVYDTITRAVPVSIQVDKK